MSATGAPKFGWNNTFPAFGLTIYPSPTATRRGRRLYQTPMRACIQCGTWNDQRKRSWSKSGEGLGSPDSEGSRDAVSGCWFCGSKNWLHNKPSRKWPDASKIPAREYRRTNRR